MLTSLLNECGNEWSLEQVFGAERGRPVTSSIPVEIWMRDNPKLPEHDMPPVNGMGPSS
jgi:hypothetical protein